MEHETQHQPLIKSKNIAFETQKLAEPQAGLRICNPICPRYPESLLLYFLFFENRRCRFLSHAALHCKNGVNQKTHVLRNKIVTYSVRHLKSNEHIVSN